MVHLLNPFGLDRVCLCAEVGTAHGGDYTQAMHLIEQAKSAGMDAVKFQHIDPEILSDKSVTWSWRTPDGLVTSNLYTMFQTLRFTPEQWRGLAKHAEKVGIVFFATADSLEGVDLLESLDVLAHKLSAWDLTYTPLIERMARTGKPIFVDLGPADDGDTFRLERLTSGRAWFVHETHSDLPPDQNLRSIHFLVEHYGRAGWSAGGTETLPDVLALALGATYIEKRLTLNPVGGGHHDHQSLDPEDLQRWAVTMRRAEAMLGEYGIRPSSTDQEQAQRFFRQETLGWRRP